MLTCLLPPPHIDELSMADEFLDVVVWQHTDTQWCMHPLGANLDLRDMKQMVDPLDQLYSLSTKSGRILNKMYVQ